MKCQILNWIHIDNHFNILRVLKRYLSNFFQGFIFFFVSYQQRKLCLHCSRICMQIGRKIRDQIDQVWIFLLGQINILLSYLKILFKNKKILNIRQYFLAIGYSMAISSRFSMAISAKKRIIEELKELICAISWATIQFPRFWRRELIRKKQKN